MVKSRDQHRKRQKLHEKTITVIEFDCTFGADRPGDPERQVVIMVATDSANKSCLSFVGKAQGRWRRVCGWEGTKLHRQIWLRQGRSVTNKHERYITRVLASLLNATVLTECATPRG